MSSVAPGPVLACLQEGQLLLNQLVLINMCMTTETALHPAPTPKSSVANVSSPCIFQETNTY